MPCGVINWRRIIVAAHPPMKKNTVIDKQVEDADALVVVRGQPGLQAVPGIEVVGLALVRRGRRRVDGRAGDQGGSGTHGEEGMGWLCAAAGWEGCERLLM